MATPIPVPICAPVDSPALEAEDVSAAAEVVEAARPSLSALDPSNTVPTDPSDDFGVDSAEAAVVVASDDVAVVDTSEEAPVDASESVVVVVLDEDVIDGVGVGLAGVLRATVVAARSDMSKDQLSELAPLPTAAPALGFKLNQHGVSEPDHDNLMRAVLLKPPTPWVCFSVTKSSAPILSRSSLSLLIRPESRLGEYRLTRNTATCRSAKRIEPRRLEF